MHFDFSIFLFTDLFSIMPSSSCEKCPLTFRFFFLSISFVAVTFFAFLNRNYSPIAKKVPDLRLKIASPGRQLWMVSETYSFSHQASKIFSFHSHIANVFHRYNTATATLCSCLFLTFQYCVLASGWGRNKMHQSSSTECSLVLL